MLTCCYCTQPACGRYCFLNQDLKVVDNLFCRDHNVEVWNQTKRSLGVLHRSSKTDREMFLQQRWNGADAPPDLPKDRAELLSKGAVYIG